MNEDLIKTPRYKFFIGDEVFLKGKIVGFDVDENKFVENIVKLEYGQTLNVPNSNIYITDNITDKSKIKVTISQFVADWIRKCKTFKSFAVSLSFALQPSVWEANGLSDESIEWLANAENQEIFARAWLDGYEVGKEKRYKVVMPNVSSSGGVLTRIKHNDSWIWIDTLGTIVEGRTHTRKELEDVGFEWVFDCPGVEVEEVEDE